MSVASSDEKRKKSSDEEYDPHLHREVQHPTNNIETLIHLIKGCIGTGLLTMPNAFKNSGLVLGILGTIAMGVISTYCVHILIKSQYILCKKMELPIISYPDSFKYGLMNGPPFLKFLIPIAAPLVDFFIVLYQLGICCVYILFVADSIKQIFAAYGMDVNSKYIMCIVAIPLMGLVMIRNLKLLAPFSTFANIITLTAITIILYFIFSPPFPVLDSVVMFSDLQKLPMFYGTILFALQAIGLMIALENNMENPKKFLGYFGVLNIGMFIVTSLYLFFGLVGYLKYGDKLQGSITMNLPTDGALGQTVIIGYAVAIFVSYSLQFYVPFSILWETYIKDRLNESIHWIGYILSALLVVVTLLAAMGVPYLDLFITLFGALCLPLLGFAIPACVEIVTLYPEREEHKYYKLIVIKDIILVIFSIVSTIIATTITIIAIVQKLKEDYGF